MADTRDFGTELARIRRVSDQSCTAHALLRDRFAWRATALDLSMFATSTWGVALAFVDPVINVRLTPFELPPTVWLGLLAVATAFLSIVQLRVDWKGRSETHQTALRLYTDVKAEAAKTLGGGQAITVQDFDRIAAIYATANEFAAPIGEADFLRLKRHHLQKVGLSKLLDGKPFALIWLVRLKLILRDNSPCSRDKE